MWRAELTFTPDEIWVEEGLEECDTTARARRAAPRARLRPFADLAAAMRRLESLDVAAAKRRLVIARRAGGFVKPFPTGDGIRASGWHYFIPAIGCPADCRYCFLQTYHSGGAPVVFAGLDAMFGEMAATAAAEPESYFYGGELCDSLMLEPFLDSVPRLVAMFEGLPSATLELRTKSDDVDPLIYAASRCRSGRAPRNVIVSWTFTPEDAAREFEPGAADTASRIAAARRVAAAGYRVGVRLDPVIIETGWIHRYERLVDELCAALPPEGIESVHIGCMRFNRALKAKASERSFPRPLCGEFAEASDGKFRYPRPVRAAAYAAIAAMVREWGSAIPVKLCMETAEVHADFRKLAQKCPQDCR